MYNAPVTAPDGLKVIGYDAKVSEAMFTVVYGCNDTVFFACTLACVVALVVYTQTKVMHKCLSGEN